MSRLRFSGIGLIVLLIAGCVFVPARASSGVGISFDFFYSSLGPHGDWLVSGSYGRVWQPAEYRRGWNPYYDGHWVYTDLGWTWVSDYQWGAVPYHYGTWVVDADLGWVWVPGYVWAPAWVVFSSGPDYIGWAPVPVGYSVGMSIHSLGDRPDLFVFVASRDFLAPRVRTCAVTARTTRRIINDTRIENTIRVENNVVVNRGPDIRIVQRATGRTIQRTSIESVPRVGPSRRMTRGDLRVDAAGSRTRLRAAEPISEKQSGTLISRSGDVSRDRSDARRGRVRERQPQAAPPQPEGEPHGRRFSPSADPQALPQADSRPEASDRGRRWDRAPEVRQPPVRQPKANGPANNDGRARGDARGNPRNPPRPRPTPSEDRSPR